jgi:hypothetical protein
MPKMTKEKKKHVKPMRERIAAHKKFIAGGGKIETVEEYLARGGTITKIDTIIGEGNRNTVTANPGLGSRDPISAGSRLWGAEKLL